MLYGILMPVYAAAKRYNYRGESDLQHLPYNNGNRFSLFPIRLRGDLRGRAARPSPLHTLKMPFPSAQGCKIKREPYKS